MSKRGCLVRTCLTLCALAGCSTPAAPEPPLSREDSLQRAPQQPTAEQAAQPATASKSGVDPRLPVVGDPLGLLSKPSAGPADRPVKPGATALDPGALMASASAASGQTPLERDARAVARGQSIESGPRPTTPSATSIQIQERSARELVRRAAQGGAKAHVLLLYAAYCKACRGVMPTFVEIARSYKARGVAFTAASVDDDREAFAAYAPVLGGALEPFWIRSDGPGTTRAALTSVGIQLPDSTFGIPFVAVFAGQNRLVTQGHSREIRTLGRTLDGLL